MARPRNEHPEFKLKRVGDVWYISWTENGRNKRRSTRERDEVAAQKVLDKFVSIYENAPPETPEIKVIIDGYIKDRKKARSAETIKHSAKPLIAFFGNLQVSELAENQIRRYARKRNRANGTIIRELGVLRASLNWAKRAKWIDTVPLFHMPVAQPRSKQRWLTKEEARRLYEAATTDHMKLYVMLGVYTGARKGAILDLKWSQVSETTIDYGEGHGNKRRAIVPIHPNLKAELDEHREIATTHYCIEYQGRPVTKFQTSWRGMVERAKLPGVTPHTLRHTCATWMAMNGTPFRKIALMLGDTERVIEQTYAHHAPGYLSDAIDGLDF